MCPQLLLLVADRFNETAVVNCISKIRQQKVAITLVGLASGTVRSQAGVLLMPDKSVAQLEDKEVCLANVLILAGGKSCAAQLLSDPRVRLLIKQVLQQDGIVALMAEVTQFVIDAGLLKPPVANQFLRETAVSQEDFLAQIIHHCK